MTHYLIEYRFQGKAKAQIRKMIYDLDNKFKLGFSSLKRPIPHISLAGPLSTSNERKLVRDFKELCDATPLCSFRINGFGSFKDSRVVYIDISPSENFDNFRWELAQKLMPYCRLKDHDCIKDFQYHATLAMKLNHQQFKAVKTYIEKQNPLKFKQFLIRAAIIKNSKILYEYDFLQRKLLNRNEALDIGRTNTTLQLLNDFFAGKYDPNKKLNSKCRTQSPKSSSSNILRKLKEFFKL